MIHSPKIFLLKNGCCEKKIDDVEEFGAKILAVATYAAVCTKL